MSEVCADDAELLNDVKILLDSYQSGYLEKPILDFYENSTAKKISIIPEFSNWIFIKIARIRGALLKNIPAALVWGLLIIVCTVIGFATWYLGLILTMPLIGHATWHAYRDVVGPCDA